MKKAYKRWLIQAPLGLSLVGFGLCMVVDASLYRATDGVTTWQWVSYGTLALVVFNAGLSIFGDAVVWRARYERAKERNEQDS